MLSHNQEDKAPSLHPVAGWGGARIDDRGVNVSTEMCMCVCVHIHVGMCMYACVDM